MTDTMLTPTVLDSVEIAPYDDTDDGADHRTHVVNPPENMHIWLPGMGAQDVVNIARITGQEIKALCGYVFVPKRNPEKYDTCEPCIKVAGDLMRSKGE